MGDKSLKVAQKQGSIYLPPQVFSLSQDSRVVTLVYLTLNDVLLLAKENEDGEDEAISAHTTVVSSTVHPKPPDVLNKPVKIALHNKKVLEFRLVETGALLFNLVFGFQ